MNINRYLLDFDLSHIEKEYHDAIIIGSGIAGVYTALQASPDVEIAILTKESIDISSSVLAQGGIAVSLDKEDSPSLHFKDTIYAGAGLCDEKSVWALVNEAQENIEQLCYYGVNFDRKSNKELSLTREGAHSKNRIIHTKDSTGKEVCDTLIRQVRTRTNVKIKERTFVIDLLTDSTKCFGVLAVSEDSGIIKAYIAKSIVCATGGYGQLYSNTTNPVVTTGDGLAVAYRAGAELTDMEFVQFHPTVLYHPENKNFLISEAVRGEGALLVNEEGKRFMPEYHELAELAPRDIVSRAIFEEMQKTDSKHVYLDITHRSKEYLENRFPNIYSTCLRYGIDISKDRIPVAPAEHYCMGGIKTDDLGRTNIKGLFACGEAACNGIHGANRLASNSLLEGLVFGERIAKQISKECNIKESEHLQSLKNYENNEQFVIKSPSNKAKQTEGDKEGGIIINKEKANTLRATLQRLMTSKVGIVRTKKRLLDAQDKIKEIYREVIKQGNDAQEVMELINMLQLARLVVESALERTESRGAHYRSDYPKTDDIMWKKNILKVLK